MAAEWRVVREVADYLVTWENMSPELALRVDSESLERLFVQEARRRAGVESSCRARVATAHRDGA